MPILSWFGVSLVHVLRNEGLVYIFIVISVHLTDSRGLGMTKCSSKNSSPALSDRERERERLILNFCQFSV